MLTLLSFLLVIFGIASAQYPLPIPFTGPAAVNGKKSLAYQDISIIRRSSDGLYFRFSKSNHTGAGMSVATAPAFSGPWTYSYACLAGILKDPLASNRKAVHLWAPEVHQINSTYYLYYGINKPDHGHGDFDIAVATSPNLEEGSWIDHGSVGIPTAVDTKKAGREYVQLGVNLLANASNPSGVDQDYKHLVFGSFNHGLYGIFLNDDLLTASTIAPTEIIADQHNPGNKKTEGNKTEGSYALHYGQYIYQFYSIGSCCASEKDANSVYRVEVCRALYSDGPNGPFVDRNGTSCLTGPVDRPGTVVVANQKNRKGKYEVFAPGSIGILNDSVEGLVMYYQYKNLTSKDHSLRFGYNYLGFDSEDWPYLMSQKSTN